MTVLAGEVVVMIKGFFLIHISVYNLLLLWHMGTFLMMLGLWGSLQVPRAFSPPTLSRPPLPFVRRAPLVLLSTHPLLVGLFVCDCHMATQSAWIRRRATVIAVVFEKILFAVLPITTTVRDCACLANDFSVGWDGGGGGGAGETNVLPVF